MKVRSKTLLWWLVVKWEVQKNDLLATRLQVPFPESKLRIY
jgi:hypothetical protein